MTNDRKDAIAKVKKIWDTSASKARSEMVTRINKDQYLDDLDHKVETYDGVKATLRLCETMIRALDPTSKMETGAREHLVSYLNLARSYALICASDVETEKRGLQK